MILYYYVLMTIGFFEAGQFSLQYRVNLAKLAAHFIDFFIDVLFTTAERLSIWTGFLCVVIRLSGASWNF